MSNYSEELLKKVGQLIFFGFDGCEINKHIITAIRQWHLGNVILFSRNFQSPEQFSRLIEQLQKEAISANGKMLFVAVDQEGGSVTRMTNGATWFAGAMATRAAGKPDQAFKTGKGIAAEMARFGLNFNLAPLVDIANNPDSAHIGSRSYGAQPSTIEPFAKEFIRGIEHYVIATAKHFPSIGGSNVDLHLQLGSNNHCLSELEAYEMAPVRSAIKNGVSTVMTSHEIYPAVENCPGTLSKKLVTDYLRNKYNFDGLIISDCMEMRALASIIPTAQGCVKAINAGVDLLLICHTLQTQISSAKAIADAVKSGEIDPSRFNEALDRINKFKSRLSSKNQDIPDTKNEEIFINNRSFTKSVCESALTCLKGEQLISCENCEKFLVLAPLPVATTMADEGSSQYSLINSIKTEFPKSVCYQYSLFASDEELEQIKILLKSNYTKIFVATYNMHTDASQIKILNLAYETGIPVIGLALRSPFDARWYSKANAIMLCYEYTPPMVQAVVRRLKGKIGCTGALPQDIAEIINKNIKKENNNG